MSDHTDTQSGVAPPKTIRHYVMRNRADGRLYVSTLSGDPVLPQAPTPGAVLQADTEGKWKASPATPTETLTLGVATQTADSRSSVVVGNTASATPNVEESVALGHGAKVEASRAVALGSGITATHDGGLFTRMRPIPAGSGAEVQFLPGQGQNEVFYSTSRRATLGQAVQLDLDRVHRVIDNLHPSTLTNHDGSHTDIGLVVEDVAAVDPELTIPGVDGQPEAVRYRWLTLFLLAEVQDLRRANAELRAMLQEAEARNHLTEKSVQELAQQLENTLGEQYRAVQNLTGRLGQMSTSLDQVVEFVRAVPEVDDGSSPV